MFEQILRTNLKWTRVTVATFAVAAFLLPVLAWRFGAPSYVVAAGIDPADARFVMAGFEPVGFFVATIAVLGAFILAAQPWNMDAAARHVYPLSLPVPWRRYVAMRYAAGALTLAVPAAALWVGALLALAMVQMPPTLRAYPGALALRFLFASLLAYSATFALQYVFGRRAALVALVALLAIVTVVFGLELSGNGARIDAIGRFLMEWPGPLSLFGNTWRLVDV
jgi:hypothetical protein